MMIDSQDANLPFGDATGRIGGEKLNQALQEVRKV